MTKNDTEGEERERKLSHSIHLEPYPDITNAFLII